MQTDLTNLTTPFTPDPSLTPVVRVEKHLQAPAARAFAAWTQPELVKEWWGPATFSCPYANIELIEGGKYLFEMKGEDGKDIWSTGTYLQIRGDEKLVCTCFPSNAQGEVHSAKDTGPEGPFADEGASFITVEFQNLQDGSSTLVLSHEGLPARMHDECVEGWSSSLDKLKRLVERN